MAESFLRKVYLFRDMTSDQLSYIKDIAVTNVYNAGDEVFSEGDEAKAFYLVVYGSVKVYQTTEGGDKVNMVTFGTGAHFGDTAFLDNEPRYSSVETIEKTELMLIDYEKFRMILKDHPAMSAIFHRAMAVSVCVRLRQTMKDLNFAREMNLEK